jgi:uncharacterized protein
VPFQWDPAKAESNARKHGIAFEEAVTVFADSLALVIEDETDPANARIVGLSVMSRLLLVVFVERAGDTIRVISARRPTRKERKRYEEGG